MSNSSTAGSTIDYQFDIVRVFTIATIVWGIIGMFMGVFIATQLAFPGWFDWGIAELTFGRLRPLHTNAVIFGFGGCGLFATSYYIVQRTCQTTLFAPKLAWFTFWGWQAVLISAAITLPLGLTSSKEYAELEWPIDILLGVVWVSYATVFFGTLIKRTTSHIYVANWFFSAFIITVGLLHVVNSMVIPVGLFKSYSIFSGATDAMVQWWYGHNAVGFYLTAAFLGMMYYFIPVQAGKPVFSYRLSIVHFWALIALYMWAGAHHLHYSALPDWTQSLGMLFSVILFVPSWGGMINGLMTLSGQWSKLYTDPIIAFLIVALAFYGMSTFEGPMMSIKFINALSHNTDWTVGHVHSGALGWVGMITMGSLYVLIPRVFNRESMWSTRLIYSHLFFAVGGLFLYIFAMWVSGISQGRMWRATDAVDGSLVYSFIDTVAFSHWPYVVRALGGLLYLTGMFIMAYNTYKTIYTPTSKA